MRVEPHIYTISMEGMLALGQLPKIFTIYKNRQANDAFIASLQTGIFFPILTDGSSITLLLLVSPAPSV